MNESHPRGRFFSQPQRAIPPARATAAPRPPAAAATPAPDGEPCPRCGAPLRRVVWGRTCCPACAYRFECC